MSSRDWLDAVLIVAGFFSPTGAVITIYRMRGQKGIDGVTEKEITQRIARSVDEGETAKWEQLNRERAAERRLAAEYFDRLILLERWVTGPDLDWHREVVELMNHAGIEAPAPPPLPARPAIAPPP